MLKRQIIERIVIWLLLFFRSICSCLFVLLEKVRCRLVGARLLRVLPAVFSALALLLLCSPMLVWGCAPDKDLEVLGV